MPPRPLARSAAALLLAGALATACGSLEQYTQERSAALRSVYPAGSTTRADVRARWGQGPDLTAARDASGWEGLPQRAAAEHALAAARRTGKPVVRLERYSGPDPGASSFLSLCHAWFYYDADDRVLDVEWQYMSD